jgi:hypothetical protein
MSDFQLKTPVAFIIFKRPDATEKVFEVIRQAKPLKLFIIADGPRTDRPGEAEKCAATRAIIDRVDWDCQVIKNYSQTNLGCAKRVASGISWVFEHVEEAIILEDDCVPHPTFFRFCEELLEKYRYDDRIGSISGDNFQFGHQRSQHSYYFSLFSHTWGWATWRRSWQQFDLYLNLWPEIKSERCLEKIFRGSRAVTYWNKILQSTHNNPDGMTWDYQWMLSCWVNSRLCIIPHINLVSNIGFGVESTHFNVQKKNPIINMPIEEMNFPLYHPPYVIRDTEADEFTQVNIFNESLLQFFKDRIKKILKLY